MYIRYKEGSCFIGGSEGDESIISEASTFFFHEANNFKIVANSNSEIGNFVSYDGDKIAIETSLTNWPLIFSINTKDGTFITSSSDDALQLLKIYKPKPHPTGIISYLFLSCDVNDNWIFEGTKVYKPNSVININAQEISSKIKCVFNYGAGDDFNFKSKKFNESAINYLSKKLSEENSIHLGVSGGLDSRIALGLLMEAGLDVSSFFIGRKKGRFNLFTPDYNSSSAIVEISGVSNIESYDPRAWSYSERMDFDVNNSLFGGGEFSKVILNEKKVGHLVNGGWGYWVQMDPVSIDPALFILKNKTYFHGKKRFYNIKRALKSLGFRKSLLLRSIPRKKFPHVWDIIKSHTDEFCSEVTDNKKLSGQEVALNYAVYILGGRISGGAFESLSNRYRPISIYSEIMPKIIHLFEQNDMNGRRFLTNYLNKFYPIFADVPGQGGNSFKGGLLARIKSVINQGAIGHGVMNYNKLVKEKEFVEFSRGLRSYYACPGFDSVESVLNYVIGDELNPNVLFNYMKFCRICELINE